MTDAARPWGRYLAEAVLLVAAVVLGFAVTEWGEDRREERRADQALAAMGRELEQNLAEVRRARPYYQRMAPTLADVLEADGDRPIGDVDVDDWLGLSPPVLRSASFDLAISTGALEHVDFAVADGISQVYEIQSVLALAVDQSLAAYVAGELHTVSDWVRVLGLLAELTTLVEQTLSSASARLNES